MPRNMLDRLTPAEDSRAQKRIESAIDSIAALNALLENQVGWTAHVGDVTAVPPSVSSKATNRDQRHWWPMGVDWQSRMVRYLNDGVHAMEPFTFSLDIPAHLLKAGA